MLRLSLIVGGAALVLVLAACGGSGGSVVARVSIVPWPEGPPGPVAATKPVPGIYVPLRKIKNAIPKTLPSNPAQTCSYGAKVQIVLNDGRKLSYGPCNRPASIEHLRLALIAASRSHS